MTKVLLFIDKVTQWLYNKILRKTGKGIIWGIEMILTNL